MFSASHLLLISNVILLLELINHQKWCQRKRKWDSVSNQDSCLFRNLLHFSKLWFSSHKRKVACSSCMEVCMLRTLWIHIRQKWQEGENYWSNCCSVNCVLAWVGHNFSKEILKQQWFNWRCCWNYILYVLKFSSFWKTVENTIVICCNICQWNWMLSILRSIQKKYTIKKLL